jgi:hypothetical protein
MGVRVDQRTLTRAIELAGRAPSVHNSQPWQFEPHDNTVDLYANVDRWLPVTDSDGRDLMLSCGAALHHLQVALAGEGVRTAVHRLPDEDVPELMAAVDLGIGAHSERDLVGAIRRRRTDRRPFANWPIPEALLDRLRDAAAHHGTLLRGVSDSWRQPLLEQAFRQAAAVQPMTPGYPEELGRWIADPGSPDGVPSSNVPLSGQVWAERRFPRTSDLGVPAERRDGATLVLLGTSSDDPLAQLRAGEALSAVLLRATEIGLASCALTQPLEVAGTRRVIRDDVLDGEFSPQVVVRLGWAPPGPGIPHTTRRPVAETLGRRPR